MERALALVGDRWSFLILREAFFGVRRFDEIQRNLDCSPNVLTDRLKKLTEGEIFTKLKYSERPPRYEYKLTQRGLALYPSITLMMKWADEYLDEGRGPPLELIHRHCGAVCNPELKCETCGLPIEAREMIWRPGPGAAGR